MFKHLHFGKAVRQVLLLEFQCLIALAASEAGSTLKDIRTAFVGRSRDSST